MDAGDLVRNRKDRVIPLWNDDQTRDVGNIQVGELAVVLEFLPANNFQRILTCSGVTGWAYDDHLEVVR